ncbi:MAG: recombinase family protein [Candidatus Acidiferrales bacterium]
MANEHRREILKGSLETSHIQDMQDAGWKPRAIEWEREIPGEAEPAARLEDVPFGMRIASDCNHLEENPAEMRILMAMMELVVQDTPMTRMAEELNRRGYRTRDGRNWTPLTVYNVFPRLVEVTPRIFSDEAWTSRRAELSRVPWNS